MSRLTFTVGSVLGHGRYSHVFNSTEQSSGLSAAIKKSRISLRVNRTFLRHEARIMQLLQDHPAIPKLFGYTRVPHFEYIAIELLGQDLKQSSGHALKPCTVARIAEQMLSALEHLSTHGIVHRDIKPENILLHPSDPSIVSLIDFGIARILSPADTNPNHRYNPIENNRNVIGTLHWCSINAHLGFDLRPYDDLESLAYTLLYLLMGDLPWRISAPQESTKNSMIRILSTKQAFTGSTIPSTIPIEFRYLLDFARNAKGDIKDDLAEIRTKIHNLVLNLGDNGPLDFTSVDAVYTPENVDISANSDESDSSDGSEPNEEYSNSYWGMDIDWWDMAAARDKTLTLPAEKAELLDGQIPEIAVIDEKYMPA